MGNIINIVRSVLAHRIIIDSNDPNLENFLKRLGCKKKFFTRKNWILSYNNEKQLAIYFSELRDANFLFLGGNGWPPSAIFQYLRNQNLLAGKAKEIVWSKPGSKIVREF